MRSTLRLTGLLLALATGLSAGTEAMAAQQQSPDISVFLSPPKESAAAEERPDRLTAGELSLLHRAADQPARKAEAPPAGCLPLSSAAGDTSGSIIGLNGEEVDRVAPLVMILPAGKLRANQSLCVPAPLVLTAGRGVQPMAVTGARLVRKRADGRTVWLLDGVCLDEHARAPKLTDRFSVKPEDQPLLTPAVRKALAEGADVQGAVWDVQRAQKRAQKPAE